MNLNRLNSYSPRQLILTISAINALALMALYGVKFAPDSGAYINSWHTVYSKGDIAFGHPPVYPLIIGFFDQFTPFLSFWPLILTQFFFFLLSVLCFFEICRKLIRNRRIVLFVSLFYAVIPGFASWNLYVLTEAFGVSFLVIYCYCFIKVLFDHKSLFLVIQSLLLGIMIFMRPIFIFLIPIHIFIYILYLVWGNNSKLFSMSGIISGLLVFASVAWYMSSFYNKYGIYNLSGVSVANQFYIARQYGILSPSVIENQNLRLYVENSYRKYGESLDSRTILWQETHKVFESYDVLTINQAVVASINVNKQKYLSGIVQRIYYAVRHPVFKTPINVWGWILNLLGPSINSLILFLLIYIYIVFRYICCHKRVPFLSVTLALIICANLMVVLLGAQDEYSRLILPSIPFAIIMAGQVLELIKMKKLYFV